METVLGADWEVERAGLINLKHPKAVAAGLTDGLEPVHVSFHALRHPTRGLYLIDTGVERAQRDWALHVPGHTAGSTAYVARTPSGPVLFVGDACHTAWGWENGVEPGTFSGDVPRSVGSLARLQRFAARHPRMEVRLGHQTLVRPAAGAAPQAAQ